MGGHGFSIFQENAMTFLKNLKNIFVGSESTQKTESAPVEVVEVVEEEVAAQVKDASKTVAEPSDELTAPALRRVVRAPVLNDGMFPADSQAILIKAQPSGNRDQCLFMVNRPLYAGHSWYFPTFESAEGSRLAEVLFSMDDVESVLVHESSLTVTRKDKSQVDWKPLGAEVGAAVREVLQSGEALLSDKITDAMPSESEIRDAIQKVIDTEVNPGVAGHGGQITLLDIQGNTVTIQMGGGCQGCSAADVTLKQGIHTSFRNAVPFVGAIFDETDHSAGLNPFF